MIRPFLAPRWLAWHCAALLVVTAFVLFGQWQLDTYGQTSAAPRAASAVELASVVEPGRRLPDGSVGQRVTVAGRYDGTRQLLVPGREHRSRTGFLVVTPLRTDTGVVAVHRGWVSGDDDPALAVAGGQVTVTGVLQRSESEQSAQVDPLTPLPRGQIAFLSTVELQEALPFSPAELYDGYVLLSSQEPAAATAPEPMTPPRADAGSGHWRNLAYALQWWLFAGAAVFFWASTIRRAAQDRRNRTEIS